MARHKRSWSAMAGVMAIIACAMFNTNAYAQTFTGTGSGTSANPYIITTYDHMWQFRNIVWADNHASNTANTHWALGANITWDTKDNTTQKIGGSGRSFRGTFDGRGYTVTMGGIWQEGTEYVGFFGLTNGATIRNLNLSGPGMSGTNYIGFLIGEAQGNTTIDNVHVAMSNVYTSGRGSGGLIGHTWGIENCAINITNSSARGTIHLYKSGHQTWGGRNYGHSAGGLIGVTDKENNNAKATVNITNSMAVVNFKAGSDISNNITSDYGGIIGWTQYNVTYNLNHVYSGGSVPHVGVSGKNAGNIVGFISEGSTVNATAVYKYASGDDVGGTWSTGKWVGSGATEVTEWTNNANVYNFLERKDSKNYTIASTSRSNEVWGYDIASRPKISKTGYAVLVKKGSGVKITNANFSSGNDFYVNADKPLTIAPDTTLTATQKVQYTFTPAYNHSSGAAQNFSATPSGNNWLLTARVNGTVSATIVNIPHPVSAKPEFDQWHNNGKGNVKVSWSYTNPNNVTGRFYVYRRSASNGPWGLIANHPTLNAVNGSATKSMSIIDEAIEFFKTYDYRIAFVEGNDPPQAAPTKLHADVIGVSTTPSLGGWSAEAIGQENSIDIVLKGLDHRLAANGSYTYTLDWSWNKTGVWDAWVEQPDHANATLPQLVNNEYKITDIDFESDDACWTFRYRVTISAFDTTFAQVTEGAALKGDTYFAEVEPFKASKGEHAGNVRLQWKVEKRYPDNLPETFRVFRRVAQSEDEFIQMETIQSAAPTVYWTDNTALAGVFYEYRVTLYRVCDLVEREVASRTDIGFTQAFGTVLGRVTFGTGSASPGVNMLARRNDLNRGEYQYYSLKSSGLGEKHLVLLPDISKIVGSAYTKTWTLQFWLLPDSTDADKNVNSGANIRIGSIGAAELFMSAVEGGFSVHIGAGGVQSATIPAGRWSHITVTRSDDDWHIYTVNDADPANISITGASFTLNTDTETALDFGRSLTGNIDDIRMWRRVLDTDDIMRDYSRRLVNNENGLRGYWPLDDNINGHAFDMSRVETVYNGNHAISNALALSSDVPDETYQLALKGVTNASGNYQIGGIPFKGEGTSYSIVPSLGVHRFNPTEHFRYISPNSTVHNATDFTNISSFKVSGKVVYHGGDYPVENCTFEIDGIQVTSGGQPVTTDAEGKFTISVPIGIHTVQVKKNGHTFIDDGYLYEYKDDGNHEHINYNREYNGVLFENTTRVKLIGHIVGGLREHEKPSGFGLRVNNIGAETIKLTAAKADRYDLVVGDAIDDDFEHNTSDEWAKWTFPNSLSSESTSMKVEGSAITITVSPETGEYVAWVYPEKYNIERILSAGHGEIYPGNESLDLSNAPVIDDRMLKTSVYSWADTQSVATQGNIAAHLQVSEKKDTVRYHSEWSFYHQETPSFKIQQKVGKNLVDYFGDAEYVIGEAKIPLFETTDGKVKYTFDGKPVFRQGELYTFFLSAFERYSNPNKENMEEVETVVPVAGGSVSLSGSLMFDVYPPPIVLNDSGTGEFTFNGGTVNLTRGINELTATIRIEGFSYYSETFGEPGLSAYVLGDRSTGTDFLTAAGDMVDFILHDPPGSNSYAYIEKGTSITKTYEKTWAHGGREQVEANVILGISTITLAGLGVMTGGEVENENSVGVSQEFERRDVDNKTLVETITFTERIETSSEPDFVGHLADVFVGRGTNTLYGLTNNVTIAKVGSFVNPDDIIFESGGYAIGKQTSMAIGVEFATTFHYTGYEIENVMIPKWKEALRTQFVSTLEDIDTNTIEHPVYYSKLDANQSNFGKRNDDPVFGEDATNSLDGPSYRMILPQAMKGKMMAGLSPVAQAEPGRLEITDSVIYYNQKIEQWTRLLAENEKRKVNAINNNLYKSGDNISFGGGVVIEKSSEISNETITTTGWEQEWHALAVSDFTFKFFGNGMNLNIEAGYVGNQSDLKTDESGRSNTVGFVLSESGLADQISVDFALDELSAPATYMFRTRGGRTSCPYEREVVTKYFEPEEHVINEGTMQIESPKLEVLGGGSRLQVPSTRAASFTLGIANESETGGDGLFVLTVDETTNPDGAILKIDGLPIGNGRYFMVASGQMLQKTLTVEKGPEADHYENIRLILASDCDPDLNFEARISVEFLPSCSEVTFRSPQNNWIMNNSTGDSVKVELADYDVNYANFDHIELLYRLKSAPQWSTEMLFYFDKERFDDAQSTTNKEFLDDPTKTTIEYQWKKGDKPDGEYEFAARTVCKAGGNVIAEYTTPAVEGYVDMSPPAALGQPSPASGIMGIGDELSITFNEDIQTGSLTDNNFSITGVLNAQEIAEPDAGVNFTGGSQLAKTELQIYTGGSFSIETWFKHDVGTAGTLFSYGTNASNSISLGFNTTGHAVVKLGGEILVSSGSPIADDVSWKYITLSYNSDKNTVSVYEFEGSKNNHLFVDQALPAVPPTQGQLTVGEGFKGAVARLHFYGVNRTYADVSPDKSLIKSGREHGLIGYWPMDEIEGTVAVDKARARNLVLTSADWYVYPSGRSMQTADSYFAVNTSTYPLDAYRDFTLEFWFRSTATANNTGKVIFCADYGYIQINENGGLDLYKKEPNFITGVVDETYSRVLTNINLMDTRWHHVAISTRRNGSVNVYIDGAPTAVFPETQLISFESGKYYFGAKHITSDMEKFSDHFNGYFDEIRIWNSALTRESIVLNKNNKLRGNEAGLLAYYPFETYERQNSGLAVTPSIANIVEPDNGNLKITAALESTPSPVAIAVPIKDVRPVENVPFSYVSSSNKIVFTIAPTYFARVEGTTLTVTVKNVYDMRDNRSSTEQWTAYIRRNPLQWESDPVYLATEYGNHPSFTARISNTGGATVSYSVVDLPPWLTVANGTGSLSPLGSRDLAFSVVPGTNIGNYETTVGLASGNGVTEQLSVRLKVSGQRPDWEVDPNEFDGAMSVIGQIKINGVFSENTEDVLGAFIGNECVGIASLTYIGASNAYFVFANVYGNNEHSGQPVTFRLWDASTGRIYPKVDASIGGITFASTTVLGSTSSPVVFNAQDIYEQRIALRGGWNWVSANVVNDDPSVFNQVTASLGGAGQIIKGQSSYVQRQSSNWIGTLSGISETSMYQVNVSRDVTLAVQGAQADPETPIGISMGWNWIGYTPQATLSLQSALAGINARAGDIIRNQTDYAVYLGAGGWAGTLTFMQPGSGYMYHSDTSAARTLVYPSNASQLQAAPVGLSKARNAASSVTPRWSVNPAGFSNSMTVTSVVLRGGREVRSDKVEIGAFSGDTCRGSVLLQYVASEDKYVGFLIVYGEGSEKISLKIYDHAAGVEYKASDAALTFSANAIHGTPEFYAVNADVTLYGVALTGVGASSHGAGSYVAGDTVVISSGVLAAGVRFVSWTTESAGVSFNDSTAAKTTFVMPAGDVSITARTEVYTVPNYPTADKPLSKAVSAASEISAGPNPATRSEGKVLIYRAGDVVESGTLAIYDATGNVVRKIEIRDSKSSQKSPDRRTIGVWDLKDAKGRTVPEGTYLLRGTVKTSNGKTERVSVMIGVR